MKYIEYRYKKEAEKFAKDLVDKDRKGYSDVFPSDVSGYLLQAAKERGLICGFAIENCENLSFPDASFDYVFCKESLHHFTHPWLALYEMLRVARRAVFCIEPNDPNHVSNTEDWNYKDRKEQRRSS